jgi:YVTN family beta-propeller protein
VTTRRSLLLAGAAALVSCKPKRSHGYEGYAFVANQEGGAIAAVDLTAFAVVRHISVPGKPTAVIAPARRQSIYAFTPDNGTVHEISLSNLTVLRSVRVVPSALTMMYDADQECLWVLASRPGKLVRVPLEEFRAGGEIGLPADPAAMDLAPDGKFGVVGFGDEGSFATLDLEARKIHQIVRVGAPLGPILFRSDGKCVMVANRSAQQLSIYDAASGRVVTHLPLSVRPENFCVRSDGGQLFITGEGTDSVVIVYPHKTPMVAETVLAGRAPAAMGVSTGKPDFLFVTNPQAGNVTVLDIATRHVVGIVAVGAEPVYVTATPDGQYALVLNRRSGDMAVIRIAAIAGKRTRTAPLFTMIPVGSGPVSAAVKAV